MSNMSAMRAERMEDMDQTKFIVSGSMLVKYMGVGDTSVTVPAGITFIGSDAFNSCRNLISVTLPDGITDIGERAFSACIKLASINLPAGLISIGMQAFEGCTALSFLRIPTTVRSIGIPQRYRLSVPGQKDHLSGIYGPH